MKKIYVFSVFFSLLINAQSPIFWKSITPTEPPGFPYEGTYNVGIGDMVMYSFYDFVPPWGTPTAKSFSISTDGGNTWTPKGVFPLSLVGSQDYTFMKDYPISENIILQLVTVHDGNSKVFKTSNGGTTWSVVATFNFKPTQMAFFNNNDGIIIGNDGISNSKLKVYTTSNSGSSWQQVPPANIPDRLSNESPLGIYFIPGDSYQNSYWFGTTMGRLYKTNNKGLNWSVVQSPHTTGGVIYDDSLGAVVLTSSTNAFTIGSQNAKLHKTVDGGLTWTFLGSIINVASDVKLAKIPNTDYLLFTAGQGTKYSTDEGVTWNTIDNIAKFGPQSSGANGTFTGLSSSFGFFFKLMGLPQSQVVIPPTITTPIIEEINSCDIYPVPANNFLYVKTTDEKIPFKIWNSSARLILSGEMTGEKQVDISWLAKGVYYFEFHCNGNNIIRKFIKV